MDTSPESDMVHTSTVGILQAVEKIGELVPGKPAILCSTRNEFSIDAVSLASHVKSYNWLFLSHWALVRYQRPWMPEELRAQSEYARHKGPVYDAAWAKSKAMCVAALRYMIAKRQVVAVMTANFDYWADEGLRLACAELKLPFLVLLREHNVIPFDMEVAGSFYLSSPVTPYADGVAVAGPVTKDVLIKCNVFGADKVRVTGLPRYDTWIDNLRDETPRKRDAVVLLSYADPGYLAGGHFYEMLEEFVVAAAAHDQVKFIVKCKTEDDQRDIEGRLAKYPSHRLTLVTNTSLPVLLPTAFAVIGFNSLALLEGFLARTDVLSPHWGTAAVEPDEQLLAVADPELQKHVTFLGGPAALQAAITKAITSDNHDYDMDARIALFQRFFAFSRDETASRRVEKFIDHYVDAAGANTATRA